MDLKNTTHLQLAYDKKKLEENNDLKSFILFLFIQFQIQEYQLLSPSKSYLNIFDFVFKSNEMSLLYTCIYKFFLGGVATIGTNSDPLDGTTKYLLYKLESSNIDVFFSTLTCYSVIFPK